MDAGAFIALLHMKALNLAPVLKMRDRWEGILPPNLDARLPFFQQDDVRRVGKDVYVSCWHASNLPNDAMWRLYSARRGIAVETTLGELAHCVQEAGPRFRLAAVEYSNLGNNVPHDGPPPSETSKHEDHRFTFKRPEFSFESEVRILGVGADNPQAGQLGSLERCTLPVDLDRFIQCVHVHPDTEPWVFGALQGILGKRLPTGMHWVHRSNMELVDTVATSIIAGEDLEPGIAVYQHSDGKGYRTPEKLPDDVRTPVAGEYLPPHSTAYLHSDGKVYRTPEAGGHVIDAGHGHLRGEYEEDGVVDLGSVQVVCHEGFRQPSPDRRGKGGHLHFRAKPTSELSTKIENEYKSERSIHWQLAMEGGITYTFRGFVVSPGNTVADPDSVTVLTISGGIKREAD